MVLEPRSSNALKTLLQRNYMIPKNSKKLFLPIEYFKRPYAWTETCSLNLNIFDFLQQEALWTSDVLQNKTVRLSDLTEQ